MGGTEDSAAGSTAGAPLLTSMPTSPSSSPTSTIATAFSGAPCASTTEPVRPSTIRLSVLGSETREISGGEAHCANVT